MDNQTDMRKIVIDPSCIGCKRVGRCGNAELRYALMEDSYRAEFGASPHADAMRIGEVCGAYITRGCEACDQCHYMQPSGKGCPF